jgi:hypothetical protein
MQVPPRPAPTVVCLSSLFMTDRILLHSSFVEGLLPHAEPLVVSAAVAEKSFPHEHPHSRYFRAVKLPGGFRTQYTLLRHFETYLWDHAAPAFSRHSFWRLRKARETQRREHWLRAGARALAPLGVEHWLERRLERLLVERAAPEATLDWLRAVRPAVVLAMYPFLEKQMVTVAAAKQLGIPVLAFITSWDNLTTKARLVYDYDGYVVWSEQMKRELHEFYPRSRRRPVTVAGAPQYDVFFQEQYRQPRDAFLRCYGLDPARPVILYCLGSPNMIREDYGALQFLERAAGHAALARAQVIVRAHPAHFEKDLHALDQVRARFPHVVIQGPHRHWENFPFQGEQGIVEWVNTVRHADVVINLSSTMTVDAAIFDRPVVNLDFDPEPGRPNQQMIKEINREWNHSGPIARSGGVWLAGDIDEVVRATAAYLDNPALHRAERRWIVEHVCGAADGNAGRHLAEAARQLLGQESTTRRAAA